MPDRKQACEHIGRVLRRFSYWKLGKADKGLLPRYLARTTGLSRAQLARLIQLAASATCAWGGAPRPSNLPDPHYEEIVCGTLYELPRAFAKLERSDATTAKPALDRNKKHSDLRRRIRERGAKPANIPTASPHSARPP